MTLSSTALKAYLNEHGTTGEKELATAFKTTPTMVAMMLEKLQEKGKVKLIIVEPASCCGSKSCSCGSNAEPKRAWRIVE